MEKNAVTTEYSSIKEVLDANGIYTGLTVGISMEPLIHHQRDNIIVVKPQGRLKKYDIPVYLLPSGKYVMHRIIDVKDDHYVIIGDNTNTLEYVKDEQIVGVLAGFYKNGKHYIDLEKNALYKLYSKIWVAIRPFRRYTMFFNRCVGWARRHIFKRGK